MSTRVKFLLLALFSLPLALTAQQPATTPSKGGITVSVAKDPSGKLHISGNLEICKGAETILKAEGDFESFTWNPGNVSGRYLKVHEAGVYEVSARTKGGCIYVLSVTVRYRPCPV